MRQLQLQPVYTLNMSQQTAAVQCSLLLKMEINTIEMVGLTILYYGPGGRLCQYLNQCIGSGL